MYHLLSVHNYKTVGDDHPTIGAAPHLYAYLCESVLIESKQFAVYSRHVDRILHLCKPTSQAHPTVLKSFTSNWRLDLFYFWQ